MKIQKLGLLTAAAVFVLATGVAPVAYAHEGEGEHSHSGRDTTEMRQSARVEVEATETRHQENETETENEKVRTISTEKREAAAKRLEDKKLKACERREKVIKNIMARISDRGQKQVNLFTTIAERTQAFYTNKNLSADNYDELVAEVAAKKTAAQATIDEVKAKGESFACSADDPKGAASSFKESLKAEIEAVKAYRTAVKNLIVGVKSAQSTATTEEEGDQ